MKWSFIITSAVGNVRFKLVFDRIKRANCYIYMYTSALISPKTSVC